MNDRLDVYSDRYFKERSYRQTMLEDRVVLGRHEPPLVATLADMVANLCPSRGRVLDVGCAYGFLVAELLDLGLTAIGIDGSAACAARSPARDQVVLGDVTLESTLRDWAPSILPSRATCTNISKNLSRLPCRSTSVDMRMLCS